MQAEKNINRLKNMLDEREKELTTAAQKLQEALSTSGATDTTIKQLEEAVQRYVPTNAVYINTHTHIFSHECRYVSVYSI